MLVLSRREKQKIIIVDGNRIEITILGCDNGKVKIGIDAPKSVSVDREEIWDRKQREKFGGNFR